ncbi:MAG: hypothetical protein CSA04_01715 [Bacteroidetes bacterium]|nr:MAG: hypothetical protein CSA04_01715 [Bacteroidota bacterium]
MSFFIHCDSGKIVKYILTGCGISMRFIQTNVKKNVNMGCAALKKTSLLPWIALRKGASAETH